MIPGIDDHLWKKIDEVETLEDLEKLVKEINDKAKDKKAMLLQKADLKKIQLQGLEVQKDGWTKQKT